MKERKTGLRFLSETYKSIAASSKSVLSAKHCAKVVGCKTRWRMPIFGKVTGHPSISQHLDKMRIKVGFWRFPICALRVIVDDERACYATGLRMPCGRRFQTNSMITSRGPSQWHRSLHTVVMDDQGRRFEIQIRTHEMHSLPSRDGGALALQGPERVVVKRRYQSLRSANCLMRQLLAFDGVDAAERKKVAKAGARQHGRVRKKGAQDSKPERIYALTPQARVIELPDGATPSILLLVAHRP